MRKDFKKEILEKIKKGKIDQRSKWYFLTKSYVFWVLSAVSTLFGSIAFATILFQIKQNNRAFLTPEKSRHAAEGFLEALPHWWVLLFIVFVTAAYLNYKNTYRNYRRENIFIVIISLLLSVVLGFLIFFSGVAKKIDHQTQNSFPKYKKHLDKRKNRIENFLEINGYSKKDLKNPKLKNKIKKDFIKDVKKQHFEKMK
jgi:glucan phosphoethanolaminetransferase (alkaline phosphatase superfamily)